MFVGTSLLVYLAAVQGLVAALLCHSCNSSTGDCNNGQCLSKGYCATAKTTVIDTVPPMIIKMCVPFDNGMYTEQYGVSRCDTMSLPTHDNGSFSTNICVCNTKDFCNQGGLFVNRGFLNSLNFGLFIFSIIFVGLMP